MEDAGLCAASTVAGCLVAPVNRLCGYVISYNSHVRELDHEVAKLSHERQKVQDSINDARNNGKLIKAYVSEWVDKVEKGDKEARHVLDYNKRAKKTCFYGWLPNPKVRYCLGREARRKAEDIQKLIDLLPSGKVYDDPPPGRVDGTSHVISLAGDQGDTIFESRASILEDVMNALDDEKNKVVGVFGPGGVGKSTLLNQVEKKLRKEGRPFSMIVKAEVSQNPDLKKIQDDIAYALDLKDLKGETSEKGRKDLLFKRLQNDPSEKVLIILDDLWTELNLQAVGIPSAEESMGCKLLLTSRDQSVLRRMHVDRTFRLEGLSDEEAFSLFARRVGDKLKEDEDLKAKAAQLVRKLAGLPLLITSVASTLKYSDVYAWENVLIKIEDPNIEKIVKWSYDHLQYEDAKCLFLLCGLIGGTIKVELLLGLGMGLGMFEGYNNTVQGSRNRLYTMLDSLHSFCLLQDSGNGKDNVTIHDLYSEVVVSTSFRGQNSLMMNSNYYSSRKEKLEKCWAICLADVGRVRLAELMRYQLPDLKLLMLSQPNYYRRWLLPRQYDTADCSVLPDFTFTKELQVLYVRSMHIARLPSSIGILGNLHSLYLDHCNVEDVAILGELKTLQILSLVGSNLSRLPKEIGNLINLRSLNLNDCDRLQTIEPDVLKDLINLEELYLQGSFDQWIGKDEIPSVSCNARLAELKSLTNIASLEISIPDPTVLLEDDNFPFGNLIKFWINIGNAKRGTTRGLRTMKLKLEEWNNILSKEWVQKILHKTQYLYLDGLKEFKKNTHELCTEGFGELKRLDIYNSPSIKYIANSSDGLPLTAFTNLESLFLKNLINLEKICNSLVAPKCFSILKAVTIEQCHRLENLWFLSEMQRLVHLEVLQVHECDSMQAIISDGAGEIEVVADDTIELPNLRRLNLCALPKMTSFCTGVEGAPIQRILKQDVKLQGLSILQNLRRLYVCKMGLSFLFSVSVAKCFREIRVIKLSDCPNMKAVIVDEEGRNEGTYDIIEFPLLEHLSIMQCPVEKFFPYPCGKKEPVTTTSDSQVANSDSFFDQKVTFPNITSLVIEGLRCKELWNNQIPTDSFQKLESLELNNCDNLQRIATSSYMWKKLHHCLKKLKVISCRSIEIIYEGDWMDTEGGELRWLHLHDLKNLRCIWQSDGLPNIPFPNLRDVEVLRCPCLEMLFPTFTEKFLRQIEELIVESCENMELIAGHEKWEEATGTTITFSRLTALRLFKLPKFRSFLPEKYSLKFPCSEDFPFLELLWIKRCGAEPDQVLGDWKNYFGRKGREDWVFLQYFIALVWLSYHFELRNMFVLAKHTIFSGTHTHHMALFFLYLALSLALFN